MGFLGAAIGGLGSLFGGLFGANASSQASQQYIKALQQAQQWMQGQEQQGLQNYQPFLNAGQGAVGTLSSLLGTPGQGLLQPWTGTFQAPTAAQAEATPGYQFQLQQGLGALQNSAAGRGSLLSGRTLADLNNYAQGVASTNYQNVFNNALTQYQTSYNSFLNNQNNQYQRLLGTSQLGLGAAQGSGQLISGIGSDIASLIGQQGAARAAGTIGSANAWSNGISGALGSLGNYFTLSALGQQGGGGGGFTPSVGGVSDPALASPQYMPTPTMSDVLGNYGGGSAPISPFQLPLSTFGSFPGLQ